MNQNLNTLIQYDTCLNACRDIFLNKSKDYGTSWRVYRTISIVDQIYIKAWRIRQIQQEAAGAATRRDLGTLAGLRQELESGTWTTYSWSFDGSLLQPGENQISISNQARGAFSLPPFFMLDYADITYTES